MARAARHTVCKALCAWLTSPTRTARHTGAQQGLLLLPWPVLLSPHSGRVAPAVMWPVARFPQVPDHGSGTRATCTAPGTEPGMRQGRVFAQSACVDTEQGRLPGSTGLWCGVGPPPTALGLGLPKKGRSSLLLPREAGAPGKAQLAAAWARSFRSRDESRPAQVLRG